MENASDGVNISLIKEKLTPTTSILVLFGSTANVDTAASALGLFTYLRDQNYDVKVASPEQVRVELSRLIGLDTVSESVSNRDLVIQFGDYDFNAIERISHNDGAGGQFELIIQPKAGLKAPSSDAVKFSHRGANADLIFLVGLNSLEELGRLYQQEPTVFQKALTVALNRQAPATAFASIHITDTGAGSLSELMLDFLNQLEGTIGQDTATNLLTGLDFATNHFQNPAVLPQTFKTAAKLLELGGKRAPARPAQFDNGNFMPFVPPSHINRLPTKLATDGSPTPPPPDDWLKPKIFTGTSKV